MMRFDPMAVDWTPSKRAGVFVHVLWSDGATADSAVLVRMDPGCRYPRHRHLREEDVLVLQGAYRDELGEHPAGSFRRYASGSVHSPVALDGAEACVLFAIARGGIEIVER